MRAQNLGVTLPYGYTVARQTKEDGGGFILYGGVNRRGSKVLGPRKVVWWDKDMQPELLESIARHDYHANTALTDNERMVASRQLVLAITETGEMNLAFSPPADEEREEDIEALRKKRDRMAIMWGEVGAMPESGRKGFDDVA
jgi:hypothetical protein